MKMEYLLDILKPHQPPVDLVARTLMEINGVKRVQIKVDELDQKTASLHIKIEGNDLSLEKLIEILESLNCALHSIDEVVFFEEQD